MQCVLVYNNLKVYIPHSLTLVLHLVIFVFLPTLFVLTFAFLETLLQYKL